MLWPGIHKTLRYMLLTGNVNQPIVKNKGRKSRLWVLGSSQLYAPSSDLFDYRNNTLTTSTAQSTMELTLTKYLKTKYLKTNNELYYDFSIICSAFNIQYILFTFFSTLYIRPVCEENGQLKEEIKAMLVSGHLWPVEQAVNTILTCYHILPWYGEHVSKLLPIYTSSRHTAALAYICSHVSVQQVKLVQYSLSCTVVSIRKNWFCILLGRKCAVGFKRFSLETAGCCGHENHSSRI